MDAKEIKSALKAAREAIKTKEYKEAVKHCKVRGKPLFSYRLYTSESDVYKTSDGPRTERMKIYVFK